MTKQLQGRERRSRASNLVLRFVPVAICYCQLWPVTHQRQVQPYSEQVDCFEAWALCSPSPNAYACALPLTSKWTSFPKYPSVSYTQRRLASPLYVFPSRISSCITYLVPVDVPTVRYDGCMRKLPTIVALEWIFAPYLLSVFDLRIGFEIKMR